MCQPTKNKSIMNKIFLNNIGDLGEAQRASYYRFLSNGISEELSNFPNPFSSKVKVPTRASKRKVSCLVYIYPHEIKLKGPTSSIDISLRRDLSYVIQLYIPSEYSYIFDEKLDLKNIEEIDFSEEKRNSKEFSNPLFLKNKKKLTRKIRIKQDIFFGEIPLMTEEGTFIISGCERIIISQIIRSPGIYFRKEFGTTRKAIYTATIISNKGLWTKFVLDERLNTKEKDIKENKDTTDTKKIENDRIYIKLNDFRLK